MTPATTSREPRVRAVSPATLRPRWRGRIHRVAAVAAVPLFAALVLRAGPGNARLACGVYACGVTAMFAVSAVYHSARLSPQAKRRMKRVDHATILLAIAGSYTAVVTLALSGAPEVRLLTIVWIATVVGIAIRMTWLHAPYAVVALVYVAVGWSALVEARALGDALGLFDTALLVGGGLLYSAGAVVYALRRPDPRPAVFGYHEVFHALVVAAAAAHYLLVVRLAVS